MNEKSNLHKLNDFSALLSCIIDFSTKFSFVLNSTYVFLHWLLFLEKIIFMSLTLYIKILWLWKWSVDAVVVQSPNHIQLFATPQSAACQASLSLTTSQNLPKFISIALMMPSSHLILWHPLLLLSSIFPSIRDFSSESAIQKDDQNIGALASASVFPMSIQGWFPLRLTGLISLLSKGLSGVLSSTVVQRHQSFGVLPSLRSNSHNRMWPLRKA